MKYWSARWSTSETGGEGCAKSAESVFAPPSCASALKCRLSGLNAAFAATDPPSTEFPPPRPPSPLP